MTYEQQLLDTRWLNKRDYILSTQGRMCVDCRSVNNLHVHHLTYEYPKLAWEYEDDNFVVLCDHCHSIRHIPSCCETPYYRHIYDIDLRAKILLHIGINFCPVCGKKRG